MPDSTYEPTCSYYISPANIDMFVRAQCHNGYRCVGYCKDEQKIVGLQPSTHYDIKVIAHKDYGVKIYSIVTSIYSFRMLSYLQPIEMVDSDLFENRHLKMFINYLSASLFNI